LCLIVYVVLFVQRSSGIQKLLYLIVAVNFASNTLEISWLLNAMEEFKAVALRSVFAKLIATVAIFIFVKSEKDIWIYAIILQFSVLLSYVCCLPSLKKYITKPWKFQLKIFRHFPASMIYLIPNIVNTLIHSTDKTLLGSMANTFEVGVYEQADKINQLSFCVISSISNVLLPRTIYLAHNQKNSDANLENMLMKAIRIITAVAIPCALGLIIISDPVVAILYGSGYEKSAILLRFLAINLLFISISNAYAHQCLIARDKQKENNIAISFCAFVNIIFNIILIPSLQSIGAAVSSAIAGVINLLSIAFYSKKTFSLHQFIKTTQNYWIAGLVMMGSLVLIPKNESDLVSLIVNVLIGAFVYMSVLFIQKDDLLKWGFSKTQRLIKK